MKKLIYLLFLISVGTVMAQTQPLPLKVVPADTVPAVINYKEENGVVKFNSVLRPLRQIAGAPEPFYTYFWEFGDGKFSFEKEPAHIFTDTLLHNVRLFATNSYDDGKPPPTRPKPLKPGSSKPTLAANQPSTEPIFFKSGGSIELKTNNMPKPGDDMMLIVGYKNKRENGIANLSGTLSVLYNDKEFEKNNFDLVETRAYNKEQKISIDKHGSFALLKANATNDAYYASVSGPNVQEINNLVLDAEGSALIKEKMAAFRKSESWKFENLKSGEEKFLFMQFKTTPEMIKDTNATINLTGMFIPDNPLVSTEFFTLELQIVASHDPNKMSLKNSRMNYRFSGKKKKLTYKVRFQNTGKGPAKKVDVGVAIADVLDINSVKILDSKPKVISCDSAYTNQSCIDTLHTTDSVHFVFKNIYLPGLKQKGVNDADSTMGYIEYSIGFKDKPKKLPFKSGAAIVFDKNEPIYTNKSTGRYKMGLSPGIIVGYGFPFESGKTPFAGQKSITLGVSIAPYAPHRYYLQAELYMNSYAEKEYLIKHTPGDGRFIVVQNANGKREEAKVDYVDSTAVIKVVNINIVPLQLRYNFNKYIGAGAGTLVSFNLDKQYKPSTTIAAQLLQSGGIHKATETFKKISSSLNDFQNTLFADLQVGKVHVGPSIGFRYLFTLQNSNNRLITYLTWKF
ncbi:PKD domain-containing protein [Pedobacter sp. B4-66]|uniref:PKD domain-containing protein n=1 Tax=Pedobacter sp. B4-66 TaxID=2817280 RepID=UPI001BD99216|nr:PKD domain-containing protein [Pedobacter sp. B4-66]